MMEAIVSLLSISTATHLAPSPNPDLFNEENLVDARNFDEGPSLIQAELKHRFSTPEAKKRPLKNDPKRKTMNSADPNSSFSSVSDDSSFIEFSSSPKIKKRLNILTQNEDSSSSDDEKEDEDWDEMDCSPLNLLSSSEEEDEVVFFSPVDSTSSSDEEQDEDEDDDWDEVDSSAPVDFPEEFQNFGLSCPIEGRKQKESADRKLLDVQDDSSETIGDLKIISSEEKYESLGCEKLGNEKFPSQTRVSPEEKTKRLEEINAIWKSNSILDDVRTPENQGLPKRKSVQFSDPKSWEEISEDEDLSNDLLASRTSDLASRRADKMRMERLMKPIFDLKHRENVFKRLFGSD